MTLEPFCPKARHGETKPLPRCESRDLLGQRPCNRHLVRSVPLSLRYECLKLTVLDPSFPSFALVSGVCVVDVQAPSLGSFACQFSVFSEVAVTIRTQKTLAVVLASRTFLQIQSAAASSSAVTSATRTPSLAPSPRTSRSWRASRQSRFKPTTTRLPLPPDSSMGRKRSPRAPRASSSPRSTSRTTSRPLGPPLSQRWIWEVLPSPPECNVPLLKRRRATLTSFCRVGTATGRLSPSPAR